MTLRLLVLLCFASAALHAQPVFQKSIRIDEYQTGTPQLAVLNDNSILCATNGYSWSDTTYAHLFKTDASGNTQWYKTLYADKNTSIVNIVKTQDGNLVVGLVASSSTYRAAVAKLTPDGTILWSKEFHEPGMDYGGALVSEAGDGSLYVFTMRSSNPGTGIVARPVLYKLDANGNGLWQKEFFGNPTDYLNGGSIHALSNGDCILTFEQGYLSDWPHLVYSRIGADGNVVWSRSISYPDVSYAARLMALREVSANEYSLYLSPATTDTTLNLEILSIDGNGNKLGAKRLDVEGVVQNVQHADDGVVIQTYNQETFANREIGLIKTDNADNVQWAQNYPVEGYGYPNGVAKGNDGYALYVMVEVGFGMSTQNENSETRGGNNSDGLLLKTGLTGNTCISVPSAASILPHSITDSSYTITSINIEPGYVANVLSKVDSISDSLSCVATAVDAIEASTNEFHVFPNPANAEFEVQFHSDNNSVASLQIVNMLGQVVYESNVKLVPGINKAVVKTETLSSGVYTTQLRCDGSLSSRKLVIAR